MLPHFTNLSTIGGDGTPGSSVPPKEPVYTGLFEINFVLPPILAAQPSRSDTRILTFQASSVTLDLTKDIGEAEQKFKFTKRKFLTFVDDTTYSFSIKFNVNVTSPGIMEPWNTLKAWYDLVWNSQTGYTHYKADTIGTVIVNQHDKKGVVLRRVTFKNSMLKGISGFDLAWGNTDIYEATANFVADYWEDEYYDTTLSNSVENPQAAGVFVPGYQDYQAFP